MAFFDYRKDKQYIRDLNKLIDLLFEVATDERNNGWSYKEFARRARIGYQTVLNLASYKTRLPRFSTVYGIARACGYTLTATTEYTLKKRKKAA